MRHGKKTEKEISSKNNDSNKKEETRGTGMSMPAEHVALPACHIARARGRLPCHPMTPCPPCPALCRSNLSVMSQSPVTCCRTMLKKQK